MIEAGPLTVLRGWSWRARGLRSPADHSSLVQADELADRHREIHLILAAERVDAQQILQARDNDRKAQRVEASFQQSEIIR